jgi:hypothetical protein
MEEATNRMKENHYQYSTQHNPKCGMLNNAGGYTITQCRERNSEKWKGREMSRMQLRVQLLYLTMRVSWCFMQTPRTKLLGQGNPG